MKMILVSDISLFVRDCDLSKRLHPIRIIDSVNSRLDCYSFFLGVLVLAQDDLFCGRDDPSPGLFRLKGRLPSLSCRSVSGRPPQNLNQFRYQVLPLLDGVLVHCSGPLTLGSYSTWCPAMLYDYSMMCLSAPKTSAFGDEFPWSSGCPKSL